MREVSHRMEGDTHTSATRRMWYDSGHAGLLGVHPRRIGFLRVTGRAWSATVQGHSHSGTFLKQREDRSVEERQRTSGP
jgi:hypothetical protein